MKYFDELYEGEKIITAARTMTETDVVMFAATTGDYNPVHTDAEFMKKSQYGQRIVHGLLGLSVSQGLLFRTGILDGSAIAFAGIDEIKFTAPIKIGDTIHGEVTVAKLAPSKSKPDRGIVYFDYKLVNQRGEIVQSSIQKIMLKKKPV